MSNTIGSGNDFSYLFNSLPTGSNNVLGGVSSNSSAFSLTDYASIKNGTYYKLTKAYYAKADKEAGAAGASDATDKAKSINATVRKDAASVKKAVDSLTATGKKSVFNKVETEDKDGNKVMDYDKDKIYNAVKRFTEEYNSLLDSTIESDNISILRNARNMTNQTKEYAGMLASVGITIGEKNELTIDEDTFKAADITTMKSLFEGANSYADSIGAYATRINQNAVREAQKMGTYTASGSYTPSGSNGSIMDQYL